VTRGKMSDRLIVALDVRDYDEAARLVERLSPHVGWFKIGSVLFTREGPRVCRLVTESGARLFLDLKFHDIPNTVRGAVTSALALDAGMLTLHASGGEDMLRAAVEARHDAGRSDVMLVAVTVLTHMAIEDFHSLFASNRAPEDTVAALSSVAARAGLDGVVASAAEAESIKRRMGEGFKVVTPGIRLPGDDKGDQTRVVAPRRAVEWGADFLVVGRPIIAAQDPVVACRRVLDDMGSATA